MRVPVCAVVLGVLLALGCGEDPRDEPAPPPEASTAVASAQSSATSSAAPASAPLPAEPPVSSSSRGAVEGSLRFDAATYPLGAPILLDVRLTNRGREPLPIDDAGYQVQWRIWDEKGDVVCDAGGTRGRFGPGHVRRTSLSPGETFRETRLANVACEVLSRPGRYEVSVARLAGVDLGSERPRACDLLLPRLGPPLDLVCDDRVLPAPGITAHTTLEILPWDRAALEARVRTIPGERRAAWDAKDLSREGALSAYGYWFCDHVRCTCKPTWERQGEWLERELARLPSSMGEGCARP